jgi:HAD superfamily hydrolase (TIGR01509 family)
MSKVARAPALIIFDFDGVVADSEVQASQYLADRLTQLGYPTNLDDSLAHYLGRNWAGCQQRFGEIWGEPAPDGWRAYIDAEIERSLGELEPVPGAIDFVLKTSRFARCIASSSTPEWIERRLRMFGLAEHFAGRIFSAAVHVSRGKPHPDIYLHASAAMGVAPEQALVIEDSVIGVTAAAAAGMSVVGLCAGSHVRDGHGERLLAAGADFVCHDFDAIDVLLRSTASSPSAP